MERQLYRYNAVMDEVTVNRLLAVNREFYDRFGSRFAATRRRLQPGVKEILNSIREDESVLDLGCGNGNFLRELARRGHKAPLLGVDFSLPLLRDAESSAGVKFLAMDLSKLSAASSQPPLFGSWSLIACFAALHHIPSNEIRLEILKTVRKLLKDDGRFILSNWQFLNSAKLRARIQPWERVGLTAGDVDEGDYLLDWRDGGEGLRYAHQFSAQELSALAEQAGMKVAVSFFSDGASGDLGLYQVWICN
jgi:SAM-dependent methyltransferase